MMIPMMIPLEIPMMIPLDSLRDSLDSLRDSHDSGGESQFRKLLTTQEMEGLGEAEENVEGVGWGSSRFLRSVCCWLVLLYSEFVTVVGELF